MPSILEYIQGEADILCYTSRRADVIAAFKELRRKDIYKEFDGEVECYRENQELISLTDQRTNPSADAVSPVSADRVVQEEEDNSFKSVNLDSAERNESQGYESTDVPSLASSESSTPCSTIKTSTDSSPSTGSYTGGKSLRLADLKETPERVREILLHSNKGSNFSVESNRWTNLEGFLDFQAAGFTLQEQLILKRRLRLQKLARSFHSETGSLFPIEY